MTYAPTPSKKPEAVSLTLRKCENCKFHVNDIEWRLCKKQQCPLSFAEMDPSPLSVEQRTNQPEEIITLENKRKFVANAGTSCPFCSCEVVIPIDEFDPVRNDKVTRQVRCREGHIWYEIYTLTNVLTVAQHEQEYPLPANT